MFLFRTSNLGADAGIDVPCLANFIKFSQLCTAEKYPEVYPESTSPRPGLLALASTCVDLRRDHCSCATYCNERGPIWFGILECSYSDITCKYISDGGSTIEEVGRE